MNERVELEWKKGESVLPALLELRTGDITLYSQEAVIEAIHNVYGGEHEDLSSQGQTHIKGWIPVYPTVRLVNIYRVDGASVQFLDLHDRAVDGLDIFVPVSASDKVAIGYPVVISKRGEESTILLYRNIHNFNYVLALLAVTGCADGDGDNFVKASIRSSKANGADMFSAYVSSCRHCRHMSRNWGKVVLAMIEGYGRRALCGDNVA